MNKIVQYLKVKKNQLRISKLREMWIQNILKLEQELQRQASQVESKR